MDFLNFLAGIGKNVNQGVQNVEQGVGQAGQRFGQELANGAGQALHGAQAVAGIPDAIAHQMVHPQSPQGLLGALIGGGAGGVGRAIPEMGRPTLPFAQAAQRISMPNMQPMTPVGSPLSQQSISRLDPQTQALARIYNQNPRDPRVAHIDPAVFGYAPDDTTAQPFQNQQPTVQQNGVTLPATFDSAPNNSYISAPFNYPSYLQTPQQQKANNYGLPQY